ncbi:MAG: phosphoribosyltransferase [Candidatus Caldarchaeum sp.]|nr:phosphoribosyltransferase [Candidatus Caldarchaeum sp.]MCS7133205.1 phosphoribosyltransferase [Candidatus Caldarchaeum sp.]MCX8201105.1 phosphoribosyltransferase [Candidatus Caldarchaeum sp.]MDW8063061.1 phosphoribosyltransferase [Candidatus Caldarchaeum sp.]MDW8434704.1 phosphoribosyltransferase [Candidatus Caldarchaeum sp.]
MEEKSVGGRKFLLLNWSDVEKGVDTVAERVSGDAYEVDTIVGILRGGVIVADLLSDILDIPEVYVVGCRSYKGTEAGELKIYHDLMLTGLQGRSVLLVDDIADTGSTLDAAAEKLLKPRNPKKIRTATLLKKPWSSHTPHYYAISTDAWVIFPWERVETIKTVGKFFVENMGFEEAVEALSSLSRLSRKKVQSIIMMSPQRTY